MPEIPEDLLRRSAEAKAKALGVPVEQVMAEMRGEAPPSASAQSADGPAAPKPQPGASVSDENPEERAPTPESVEEADEAAPEPEPETIEAGEVLDAEPDPEPAVEAESESGAVSTITQEEAVEADATDEAPESVSESGTDSNGATDSNGSGDGNGRVAAMVSPRPVEPPAGSPEGVRTQRLLTVVKARAIQQVKPDPTDKVNTWPHLMLNEFVALLAITALLVVMSVVLQAPLLEPANFNSTPNPSKAPWYFLGLQELLSYFDPQIGGVTVPTIIGLVGFMFIPYVDRNPSTKPSDRKFAIMLFTFFLAGAATLTIFGVLFRGPGFNFVYPWEAGVFFDDLRDWVHFEGEH